VPPRWTTLSAAFQSTLVRGRTGGTFVNLRVIKLAMSIEVNSFRSRRRGPRRLSSTTYECERTLPAISIVVYCVSLIAFWPMSEVDGNKPLIKRRFTYGDGHIIIGALFPVHRLPSITGSYTRQCGEVVISLMHLCQRFRITLIMQLEWG
jgi:hypothetical protein